MTETESESERLLQRKFIHRAARASCTAVLRKCVVVPVGTAQAAGRAHGVALHGRDGGTLAPPASNEPNESNKQIKQTNQTNQTNRVQNRVKLAVTVKVLVQVTIITYSEFDWVLSSELSSKLTVLLNSLNSLNSLNPPRAPTAPLKTFPLQLSQRRTCTSAAPRA